MTHHSYYHGQVPATGYLHGSYYSSNGLSPQAAGYGTPMAQPPNAPNWQQAGHTQMMGSLAEVQAMAAKYNQLRPNGIAITDGGNLTHLSQSLQRPGMINPAAYQITERVIGRGLQAF